MATCGKSVDSTCSDKVETPTRLPLSHSSSHESSMGEAIKTPETNSHSVTLLNQVNGDCQSQVTLDAEDKLAPHLDQTSTGVAPRSNSEAIPAPSDLISRLQSQIDILILKGLGFCDEISELENKLKFFVGEIEYYKGKLYKEQDYFEAELQKEKAYSKQILEDERVKLANKHLQSFTDQTKYYEQKLNNCLKEQQTSFDGQYLEMQGKLDDAVREKERLISHIMGINVKLADKCQIPL